MRDRSDRTGLGCDHRGGTADHPQRGGGMTSVAFHPDGRRLLAANEGPPTIKLWDTTTGQELRTFRGLVGNPTGVRFSPDGRRVIAAAHDATVRIWETDTGLLLRTLGEENR